MDHWGDTPRWEYRGPDENKRMTLWMVQLATTEVRFFLEHHNAREFAATQQGSHIPRCIVFIVRDP